jgi:ATP-binding cassette subfamily F protein 3
MNLLQLQRGSKHFGTRVLFDEASFSINAGEHVGVIGPNGAGKTTLFKILVGQEQLDEGTLTRSQSLRVGYLEQEAEWALDVSAETYLIENCSRPIWELKQLGRDLGLDQSHFDSPLRKLSGGYRMRMKLLYLIGQEPNLMLLDEPTNFLDLESVLALEKFLQDYNGAFLLISHDREFLRRTTDHTLEVEGGDITKFPGHIDDYFEQKAQLRAILEAQAANLEAKRKRIQDFVTRFGAKATKARQAQSRLKQLDRMESVEIKDLPIRARIRIPAPAHTGRDTLVVDGADFGYGARAVLSKVGLRLERGAHLGVVGVNGAGKSTLLKSLAGLLPPLSGRVELGYQVSLSYFSQHSAEQLHPEDTVLESLQRAAHRDVDRQDILNMAGSLLFSGDDTAKKVRVLSGGEKSRVALGQILLRRSPLLLLDEPTNHLDFDTVEALTEALRDYAGGLVVVSHDRSFIGRVATRILEIDNGRVELYPGSYDEYVWSVQKGALSTREAPAPSARLASAKSSAVTTPARSKNATAAANHARLREAERSIKKLESKLAEAEQARDRLTADLSSAASPAAAAELSTELGRCIRQLEELEEDILRLLEEAEALRAQTDG